MTASGWGRHRQPSRRPTASSAAARKAAYVAAKHGLIGLTKVGALEVANAGITVNAICPGWVLTPLVQAQIDARAKAGGLSPEATVRDLLAEKQPMLEFSTPEGIGGMVLYLWFGRGADGDRCVRSPSMGDGPRSDGHHHGGGRVRRGPMSRTRSWRAAKRCSGWTTSTPTMTCA